MRIAKKVVNSDGGQLVTRPSEADFTMVLFPDTQNEVQFYPKVWESMPSWVANNKISQNIQAVIGLGDVTNEHTGTEFQEAVKGWDIIDHAGLPYIPIIGNHDYNSLHPRNAMNWNGYLGVNRFSAKSWYGGAYNNSTENYWIKFDVGSHKYLILALEFFPRLEALHWAQSVISDNPDREVIVATHGYLNSSGDRTRHGDAWGPDDNGSDGQQIWDNLIKLDANTFLTVCGHQIRGPTSAYSRDSGIAGNTVHQLFINHQEEKIGGDGYMGLLKFQPTAGTIEVTTYSAYLNAYDSTGTYTLSYTGPARCFTAQPTSYTTTSRNVSSATATDGFLTPISSGGR